eukprot:1158237-Pelagomonas_calceolata.AAC.3
MAGRLTAAVPAAVCALQSVHQLATEALNVSCCREHRCRNVNVAGRLTAAVPAAAAAAAAAATAAAAVEAPSALPKGVMNGAQVDK